MPVLEHAHLSIGAGQERPFEAAFEEAKLVLAASPGFLGADLFRGVEEPTRYLLLVRWESLEAHMVGFRGSSLFTQWRALLGPYFADPPVVDHAERVSGAAPAPAGEDGPLSLF
jgi:heme-degrading monooxygenase HmoA